MRGKGGLTEQLNGLKSREKRKELIQWLGHKVIQLGESDSNKTAWNGAVMIYAKSSGTAFKIFGVVVREAEPDERDLKSAYGKVAGGLKNRTYLELLALHVPSLAEMENAIRVPN